MAFQSKYAGQTQAGGPQRISFLNKCIMEGTTDYVFEFLVSEYRNSPTKKKAIALYDLFCAANAPYRLNCDELLPPKNPQLTGLIDWYREQRAAAQQMNFIKRIATSGNRTPLREQFDFLLPAIFRQEDNAAMNVAVQQVASGAVKRPTSGAQKSFVASWANARRVLIDAGFSSMQSTWGP
ncbi:MAG TPA: hypothetical protein VKB34_21835 [Povalibacter sp.]|nr:hypothetical protein [Povalibacter sp.]